MVSGRSGRYRVEHLHQPDGWLSPAYLSVDERGFIDTVSGTQPADWAEPDIERINGFVIPGMLNVHSHVHQRGLAGRVEPPTNTTIEESFWTWRTRMYDFANRPSPEEFEALAAQAFLDMVSAGFTSVGEFHYLHNAPDGRQYDDVAELSTRVISAAEMVGIGLTMLPTLYTRAGIGRPLAPEQRRFILAPDTWAQLVADLVAASAGNDLLYPGIAPHSLRAVDAAELSGIVSELVSLYPDLPVHLHVAEQIREVEECLAGLGKRPGEWLLNHFDIDNRWTFIHSTHCDADERKGMSAAGVVAGLCPTTEAELGDGIFPLGDYSGIGGVWGIGTDSNNRISVAEQLRLLAFSQRLTNRSLFTLPNRGTGGVQPGRQLYDQALEGGTRALRQPVGAIVPGRRADFVVLDPNDAALISHGPDTVLDGLIFNGTSSAIRDVYVGGLRVVKDGHHLAEDVIFARYRATIARLTS